jgi:tricorn protease
MHQNLRQLLIVSLVFFASLLSAQRIGTALTTGRTESGAARGGLAHFPDVGATNIVFVSADELWLVPRGGGVASLLPTIPGRKNSPKFSPDSRSVAFVNDSDIYTIPVKGGTPSRITYHPAAKTLCDWTDGNLLLYYTNGLSFFDRAMQLFTVPAAGGISTKLAVPYGADGAIRPGGRWLAYTPYFGDYIQTWKRYVGGMAPDIWLFDLRTHVSRKATDWKGTDTFPMWHGDDIYYLSDGGPERRLNIWQYATGNGARKQITNFGEYDVKYPSIGPGTRGQGEIVFQYSTDLYLLDISSGKVNLVTVSFAVEPPTIKPRAVDASKFISNLTLSPSGDLIGIESRGDIWTLTVGDGAAQNLTKTSGVAERSPAWSPDGNWIAYFSDLSGEYELYVHRMEGGETKQLTSGGKRYRLGPVWSPDSKRIAFSDVGGATYIHTIGSETRPIDKDSWFGQLKLNNYSQMSWSPDSSWLAYTKTSYLGRRAIWLYDVVGAKSHQVTSGRFSDTWPTFDRRGRYLFFVSNRDFSPTFGDPTYQAFNRTMAYVSTQVLLVVPLRRVSGLPASVGSAGDSSRLAIDLEDFERRATPLGARKGAFLNLAVTEAGTLLYIRQDSEGGRAIKAVDLTDVRREEKLVLEGVTGFHLSADGKKLLVRQGESLGIVDAAASQRTSKPISTSGMTVVIDPRQEWRQIFSEVWRQYRDLFYDPNMHGVDWPAMRERYSKMLGSCITREDLNYCIGEMIAELNVSHASILSPGDVAPAAESPAGLLGIDLELSEQSYRITKIYRDSPWDWDSHGPLSRSNVDVKEGDYLLAVNGVIIDTGKDPWAAFVGLVNAAVTLTVSSKPRIDETARQIRVRTMSREQELFVRYRAWVEQNRAYVERKSGGRVGYVYVGSTENLGYKDFPRQFYGQVDKEALIIDVRWNLGGDTPDRLLTLLNRPVDYFAPRDAQSWSWPYDTHVGPKVMLINGMTASGGELFAYDFRQVGLGRLIGERTWGGGSGHEGVTPDLIDGGAVQVPNRTLYKKDGTWGIEGYGVKPDVEVIDDPQARVNGDDPQLDAAIEQMLREIKTSRGKPSRPAYPNRSGMGIRKEDQ